MRLRRAGKGYGLGVNADSQFNSWIGKPAVAGTAAHNDASGPHTSSPGRSGDVPQAAAQHSHLKRRIQL